LAEIDLFVNRFNYNKILSKDLLYSDKISYEHSKNWINSSIDDMENNCGIEYYVLEDENIIKGYFSIGFPQNNEGECELIDFCIDVPFQKNGFGTLLMNYCIELVKNKEIKLMNLNVFEEAIIAVRFYEKYKFRIENKRFSKEWNTNILKYKKYF
jgi:ribosomal protein S18 acetylase RimI-like enzyme